MINVNLIFNLPLRHQSCLPYLRTCRMLTDDLKKKNDCEAKRNGTGTDISVFYNYEC